MREPAPMSRGDACMSASQLLLQRYMIANPPRTFGKPCDDYDEELERTREDDRAIALREQACRDRGPDYGRDYGRRRDRHCNEQIPANIEIIPCPECDDNPDPKFSEFMREFHKSAVLIPSEES